MKHVNIFSFLIDTIKYFSSTSLSNMNEKIEFWTIAKAVDKQWWMNEWI